MAGYNESGTGRKQLANKEARAYCEGMTARIALFTPVNPYSAPNLAEEIAWDAGVAYAATFAGGALGKGSDLSCAVDVTAVVPAA